MMGGGQSHEGTSEKREEETEKPQTGSSTDSTQSAASEGQQENTQGELPQCRMGNRKVDNMCFMITCTNWY
ncbi:hypothetical protein EXN66_Car006084 [Channa argus]|uniref:Uncharacterized protein n=1 Tax=Channa argus TaxID=215402 RepID=A0A6G1PJA4_CHAAH|nr:hypothetical protein EXN66_Car006084 [Channa argus]